ncbi:MAG: hypothetical protein WCJ64_03620 [Rhodospirillaceae bacterium]
MPVNSLQALDIVSLVLRRANESGQPIPNFVVLVGGTALSAHAVRDQSEDVDFYTPESMDDAAVEVENELRLTYGSTFKIDVTVGENLWGDILLRDIDKSPELTSLNIGSTIISIKLLPLTDLFLLKLAADREKDRSDLLLMSSRVLPDDVIARFNQLIKWHGNRNAIMGFADSFVITLHNLYNLSKKEIIAKLEAPAYIKVNLTASYCDDETGHDYPG